MKKLAKYIKPQLAFIALSMAIKFVSTYLELWIPSLMEKMLRQETVVKGYRLIFLYGGLMLLCAAFAWGLNLTANRMNAISSGKITKAIRHDLFEKIQHLSARQMDKLTISSAESRLTSDTYNINQFLTRMQRSGIRSPILLIGGIIMMLQMDWQLSLILLAALPIISVSVFFVTKKGRFLYAQQHETLDDVVQVVQENITGIRVVKALSKTDYEKKRFGGVNTNLSEISQAAGRVTSITGPISAIVLNMGLTAVVVLGAYRVNSGNIESGVIIASLQYFVMILNSMTMVTRMFMMWSRCQTATQRVWEVLDEPEDLQVLPAKVQPEENAPHIEFRDVSFSYTGVGKNLENLSFRLEHGQTLGILGGTGSGKTTLLNLLLRLYDVDDGQIFINGQDIKTIPYESLREKFGVVFQNDFVTAGTIEENIRFFRDVDQGELERAAECAQGEFIAEKEGKMQAQVAIRGNNLSGGQKQRLLIARALAGKPEILVLDDASSALDYRTDAAFRKALRENYRQTTTVLVTQRISSLQHADLILVLSDGVVIGAGKHDELMEQCEEYQMIAQAQMGDKRQVL